MGQGYTLGSLNLQVQRQLLEAIVSERPRKEGLLEGIPPHDAGDMAQGILGEISAMKFAENQFLAKQSARLALEKIANGSYGTCEDCEEPISQKRLLALPSAIRCIRCQEMHDFRMQRITKPDLLD